jgi:hypothetical protein
LTPPLQLKGGVKPPHSKGFAATYKAEFLLRLRRKKANGLERDSGGPGRNRLELL